MAGRSRTNVPATIYKDFQPKVERKEEQGANILLIHLPGFPMEQINVSYVDSSRTIKVQAERALEKNTRSHFNQAFPVPENCILEKLHCSLRNGVLTITMPKKTITQVGSVKNVSISKETSPPKAMKDQKGTSPKAASTSGVEKQRDEKVESPQPPRKAIAEPKAPMATGPQTASPKAVTNGKKVEALQPSKQQEETQKKVSPIATPTKQIEEKTAGSTSTAEIVEKKAESKDGLKDLVKEKESGKTKDSMSEADIPKISEKGKENDKAGGAVEKKPKEGGSSFLEKAKEMKGMDTIMKTVKSLATDDYEDRQLLINIGVSVLMIVAIGAYITYSYRSSRKANN